MGHIAIRLIRAKVGHARLTPKKNVFSYRVVYVSVPIVKELSYKTPRLFSFDHWNILSIRTKKYLGGDTSLTPYEYVTNELRKAGIPTRKDYQINLLTLPRLFGYSFNPISYWLVRDADGGLRAVLCAVTNTFHQTHNYLLAKPDHSPITPEDIVVAAKHLYVSPYNKTEGHYEFSFTYTGDDFKSVINYFDADGTHLLNTYLGGHAEIMTSKGIVRVVFAHPLMTFLVVARIHWQAVKLLAKRVSPTLRHRAKIYENNQTTISKQLK